MKRIALLIETSLASGRQILSGIARYMQEHNDVSIFHMSGTLGEMNPAALAHWQGDGVIARVANDSIAELLQRTQLPVVDVLGNVTDYSFPLVKCNNHAIGEMVALEFAQNGFRHLAVIGMDGSGWSLERESAFLATAAQHGADVHQLRIQTTDSEKVELEASMAAIRDWLPTLPKPAGVMVTSDRLAPLLFEAAHELGIRIPEELSVIGVDNDAPFCELCRPALSSVIPNHEEVGYLAAQLLDRIIEGDAPGTAATEVRPRMIQLRRSSSALAVDDRQLALALEYIRTHAAANPSIDQIAQYCGLSRSVLQRRFRSQLNRTVGESILNEKLNRAKDLLYRTDLSIHHVAEQSGFNCQEYLSYIFRKHLSASPGQFRKRLK